MITVLRLASAAAIGAATFLTVSAVSTPQAHACGCFAPPDPSVPVVQAGERIVFQRDAGVVTAHIQVQYAGPAADFGWLLPMPAIPEVGVGTDELFTQVIRQTQPLYRVNYEFKGNCPFDPNRSGGGGAPGSDSSTEGDDGGGGSDSPLVFEDAVGPYDFAVLRADAKQPMLDWLDENGYFVPAGTDDVVDAYIRPNAYFLALRLQKGNDAGDIQPVVVKYASDLPVIPIILTSVAADPDMGVQVWVVGDSRAIPRNYFHTRINDARVDWFNAGANYAEVVTNAVDEAEGHHSFVTEYAGTTSIMDNQLDYPGRFGDPAELRAIADPITYVSYMTQNGYTIPGSFDQFGLPQWSSQALAVLQRHLPVPEAILEQDVSPGRYYSEISYWMGPYRQENPEHFSEENLTYDPVAMTQELEERVVAPSREAAQLFVDNPYMTRLFTTLSPHEMVKDPVFSFNPDLPEVSNIHEATGTYYCGLFSNDTPSTAPLVLTTEDGFELSYPDGTGINPFENVDMPWSWQTQILREEGAPETVTDNRGAILAALDFGGGCSVAGARGGLGSLLLLGLALVWARRRWRA
jgi:hypothetical protein